MKALYVACRLKDAGHNSWYTEYITAASSDTITIQDYGCAGIFVKLTRKSITQRKLEATEYLSNAQLVQVC